jgi:hypothetical protein
MSCDAITKQLPLFLYGELTFDEEEQLQQHLDTCTGCRGELDKVRAFHRALDSAEPAMDARLLDECRQSLQHGLASIAEAGTSRRRTLAELVRSMLAPAVGWAYIAKPLGALALIAAGFFGGRMLPGDSLSDRPVSRLSEPLASRIRFIEPDVSGQVQIVVEETRQRVLSGDPGDDRIRNLLLTAARDSSDPGVRVGTMDLLKGHSESEEVRRALIYAVQNDTNPGVRLKALEGLRNSADLPDVRRALSQVLLNDENPGVRTQSIDLLVQKREPALIGVLQELMAREENDYVRLKCQKALHEMNASVETF